MTIRLLKIFIILLAIRFQEYIEFQTPSYRYVKCIQLFLSESEKEIKGSKIYRTSHTQHPFSLIILQSKSNMAPAMTKDFRFIERDKPYLLHSVSLINLQSKSDCHESECEEDISIS